MADTKISDLTAASTVSGSDVVPIVQSATTKKATLTQIVGLVGGTTYKVSGSNFTSTSTSLTNITGLSHAAAINTLYEVDCVLKVQSTDTNMMKFALACSAAGSTGYFSIVADIASMAGNILGSAGANVVSVATSDRMIYIKGIVTTVGSTGNITVQVLKNTSGTATVYIGSRMTVTVL